MRRQFEEERERVNKPTRSDFERLSADYDKLCIEHADLIALVRQMAFNASYGFPS